MLLLFLGATEEEIEQALGGRRARASTTEPASAAAATSITRRRMRKKGNSVRNAYSTRRNKTARDEPCLTPIYISAGW